MTDDALRHVLLAGVGEGARQRIGAAAGLVGHHQFDGVVREVALRCGARRRPRDKRGRGRDCGQAARVPIFKCLSPFVDLCARRGGRVLRACTARRSLRGSVRSRSPTAAARRDTGRHRRSRPARRCGASGIAALKDSSICGVEKRSWNGVWITPGATALTRMLSGASSFARPRVAVLTNPLAPAYR